MSCKTKLGNHIAELSHYGKGILKIVLPDGKEHYRSGAILSREESELSLCNTPDGFEASFDGNILTAKNNSFTLTSDGKAVLRSGEDFYIPYEKGFRLEFNLPEGEKIFGLGEDNDIAFGRLDRRGTVRDLLTGQRINQNHVTADFPIPLILSSGSSKPYGIFIDNTSNMTVDIGKTDPKKLTVDAISGACELYIITGESLNEIVCSFSQMTGRAKLPPLWVLGYNQSKCSFWNWEEMDDAIMSFKENGIPLDCVVFDFDWAEYFNNYKWAERWEGKSPEKIAHYREKYGIHFMASNSGPMLKKNSDTFESAVKTGILAKDSKGELVTCGHYSGELMDFTNPKTAEWLYPQLEKAMDDGIETWWLDLVEPEGDAPDTVYFGGEHDEVHNIFSNSVSQAYHDAMKKYAPGKRSFVLTRTGTAGIQREPTALWTGDMYSEYGTLKAHIPEALNTQLSGIPMWTCDTGGFLSPTNNEQCPYNMYHNDRVEHGLLFERWAQFSCFTPLFRSHHAGEAVPSRFQPIVCEGINRYIKERYRIIPYLYALYYENHLYGTPIMRPLFWHYPDDERAYATVDEYLFGENMLVAPVTEPNVTYRKVYLPAGVWYDYDYGYRYEGGREYDIYAPQNRIPVFIKEGGIIPMWNVTADVQSTRDLDLTKLDAEIYPSIRSHTEIYADDGESEKYLSDEYTCTAIDCIREDGKLTLKISPKNELYPLRELTLHIHMDRLPESVKLNGNEIAYFGRLHSLRQAAFSSRCFDEFNRLLHVKLLLEKGENTLEITLNEDKAYPPLEPFNEDKLTGQLPYIYPPASLPCEIQAIHYDRGGEGVAFHKSELNIKGAYRDDNAGICEVDKLCYISGLSQGEWLEYSVSNGREGSFEIALDGDLGDAEIKVSLDKSEAMLKKDRCVLPAGTGQMILRIEVISGSCDIVMIRINCYD